MRLQPPTRQREYEWLIADANYQANEIDKFADDIEKWGRAFPLVAEGALGLIERGERLRSSGEFFANNELIGGNTRSSLRNDRSIALGGDHGFHPRGAVGYATMYAFSQEQKYGVGCPLADLDSKASGIRVYAAALRVVAGIAQQVISGEYTGIG